jgi:hypothetical protein
MAGDKACLAIRRKDTKKLLLLSLVFLKSLFAIPEAILPKT